MNTDYTQAVAERQAAQTAANEKAAQAAEKEAQAMERLRRSFGDLAGDVMKAQRSNDAMRRSLRDGTFARASQRIEQLRREESRYRREAELRGRYGDRLGGTIARNEKPLHMLESAARTLMAKTEGLYNRGMQGTVEQGRREMELNVLGREVASIFKPVSDVTTEVVRGLRRFLSGLNRSEQNLLLGAGVAATGALSAVAMARGGRFGALALGGAGAAGLAGGMGVGDMVGAGLGARALWGLRGGATAAAEGGGMAASLRAGWATMPEVVAATKVAPEAAPSLFSRAATRLGGLAASKGFGMGGELFGNAMNIYEGYGRRREEGGSMGGSLFRSMLSNAVDKAGENYMGYGTWKSVTDIFSSVTGGKPSGTASKKDDEVTKRRVAMQGGGFQESGSGYEQIAMAYGKVAEVDETKKGEGEVVKAITEIGKMLAPIIEKAKESAPELRRPEGH
jgi:hypothetical protein